jgi:hypothetical protein
LSLTVKTNSELCTIFTDNIERRAEKYDSSRNRLNFGLFDLNLPVILSAVKNAFVLLRFKVFCVVAFGRSRYSKLVFHFKVFMVTHW